MKSDFPTFSIIIPTYNEENNIGVCLKSIQENDFNSVEVIIVDQSSTDATPTIAKKYDAQVISVEKPPYYRPPGVFRNRGFERSSGEYIYHLDADMRLEKGLLTELQSIFQEDSEVVAVVVPEKDVPENIWAKAKAYERSFAKDVGAEAARASRREVFEKVLYNTEISSGEDWYIHSKFKEIGKIKRSKKKVFHMIGRISLKKEFLKKYRYGKASSQYVSENSKKLGNIFINSVKVYLRRFIFDFWRKPNIVFAFVLLRFVDTLALLLGLGNAKFKNKK